MLRFREIAELASLALPIISGVGGILALFPRSHHQPPSPPPAITQSPSVIVHPPQVTVSPSLSPNTTLHVNVTTDSERVKSDISGSTSFPNPPTVTVTEGKTIISNPPNFTSPSYPYYPQDPQLLKRVTILTASGSFLIPFFMLRHAEHVLQQKDRWFNWGEDVATEKLAAAPQDVLAQQLIPAIQQRYVDTKYIHDFVQPLKIFLTDIEQESAILKRYINLGTYIQRLWLGKLFGISDLSIQFAQERLTRLEVLQKNIYGMGS